MYPVPHLLLFLPICVFAGLFAAAVVVNFVVAAISPRRRPARRAAANRAIERTGAQIIYFKPRKSALPSNFSLGAR
jgi:hypothetical protein